MIANKGVIYALLLCCVSVFLLTTNSARAESVVFTVNFPVTKEQWMRDVRKHISYLTVEPFNGNVEYKTRVVNIDTGQVVPSGSTVAQGTRLRFEFLPESMSWHTTASMYDSPYAYWTSSLPPAVSCSTADRIRNAEGARFKGRPAGMSIYAPVYAVPPAKTVQNTSVLGTCSTTADSASCTVSNVGTHTVTFAFADSVAHQFVRIYSYDQSRDASPPNRWPRLHICEPMGNLANVIDFAGAERNEPRSTVPLPAKTLPFTITVTEEVPPADGPQSPSVSAVGGSCIVGMPFSIQMNSLHTQNKPIRYLIDWNGDGTVDQTIPTTDYVPAGTSQTTSRTYATPGPKDVLVRAQDDAGALSPWGSFSFTCEPAASATAGLLGENIGATGGNTGSGTSANDLSIRVTPSLVRKGVTTKVHWSSQNMNSCSMRGSNGDAWSGLASPVNGEVTSAILGQVTYTLTCRTVGGETYSKQATVNVLPSWREQ